MGIADSVINQGIASDVAYVGDLMRDLNNPRHASFASSVSFCVLPFFSLFAYESHKKLKMSDPALATSFSPHVEQIVKRSRHTLKLFEDDRRGIDGQVEYFRGQISPAHKSHFLDSIRFGLGRFLGADLGLYSYGGRLIATTHGAAFNLGVEPVELLKMKSEEVQAIYEEYGRYFGLLGARLDSGRETFISHVHPARFNQPEDDVRSDRYYRRVFDGAGNPDLNALLTVFRCMMNFVDSVIAADADTTLVDYTMFKIRYLTLYQVLASLQMLHADQSFNLTGRSVHFMERILDTPDVQLIMARSAKPFRNTLMHYNLDTRIDPTRVDIDQPLFGLIPIYFPIHDVPVFAALVDRSIRDTATLIEDWAAGVVFECHSTRTLGMGGSSPAPRRAPEACHEDGLACRPTYRCPLNHLL